MIKKRLLALALLSIVGMGVSSCANTTPGEQGPVGPQGPQGEQGEPGEPGEPGDDGSIWHTGSGVPSDTLGKDTDMYLDTSTNDVYQKVDGSWVKVSNIQGADGEDGTDGNNGHNGATGPQGPQGEQGDTAWSNTILPTDNGYVLPSVGSALVGEDVTFTFVPDSGNVLSSLLIFNNGEEVTLPKASVENNKVSYTLAMQEGGFVVFATFGAATSSGQTSYYKDGQKYQGGLVDGLGNIITEGTLVDGAVDFEGGSGTSDDPLLVENRVQFAEITNTGESFFKLSENADFTGENKVDALPSTSEKLKELSLDLNEKTIEFVAQEPDTKVSPIMVASDTTLTYKNGKIEANRMRDGGLSLFALGKDYKNNNIVLDNMEVETNGTGLYTQSVGSDIVIRDSIIHAGDYGVGTNASEGSAETDQISITIENSTISTLHEGDLSTNENLYTNTGLFINVSAEVVVRDSIIEGDRQAVIVRGGDVTLEDTTLNYTGNDYYSTLPHCYDGTWFTGNGVPVAAVTLGNNEANAYSTTTKLTMSGVIVNELTSIGDSNSEMSLLADETPLADPEKPYLLYANGESEENNVTIISDSSSYEQFEDNEGRVYINSLGDKVLLTIDDSVNTLRNNVFVDGQLYSSAYYDGDTFVEEKSVKVDGVKFNGGSGTEEDPLLISNSDEFNLLNEIPTLYELGVDYNEVPQYYFKQTQDIKTEHVVEYFNGIYDGGNYTLSLDESLNRQTGYNGIFGHCYGSFEIKNLNVVLNDKQNYSLIFDAVDQNNRTDFQSDDVLLENITINVTDSGELTIDTSNFGFIVIACTYPVLDSDYYNHSWTLNNVDINGSINSSGTNAAGYFGYNIFGYHLNFKDCDFNGNVYANQYAGLFSGNPGYDSSSISNDKFKETTVVENCTLNGVISASDRANVFSLLANDDKYYLNENMVRLVSESNIISGNTLSDLDAKLYLDPTTMTFYGDSSLSGKENLDVTISVQAIYFDEEHVTQSNGRKFSVQSLESSENLTNLKEITSSNLLVLDEEDYKTSYSNTLTDDDFKYVIEGKFEVALVYDQASDKLIVVFKNDDDFVDVSKEATIQINEYDENNHIIGYKVLR